MTIPGMHAFDTHKYIKELTKSGFKEGQAEIIIKSILESRDYDFSKLATKEQLVSMEKDVELMKKDVELMKKDVELTKKDVAFLKQDIGLVKQDIGLVRQDIGLVRQEMSKFATKEQLETMEERFVGRLSVSENTMLKWIVPLFITTWAMMAGIAFKLFSH